MKTTKIKVDLDILYQGRKEAQVKQLVKEALTKALRNMDHDVYVKRVDIS